MIKKQYIIALCIISALAISGIFIGSLILGSVNESKNLEFHDYLKYNSLNITWLGNCGFKIKSNDLTVYIDPVDISENGYMDPANIIIITHSHSDHLSQMDLEKIVTNETTIIACGPFCEVILNSLNSKESYFVIPGDNKTIYGIYLRFTTAYTHKNSLHPQEMDYCGVIIDFGETIIYHTGDSEPFEEMKTYWIDIVLIPLNEYVMTVDEMVTTVNYLVEYNSPNLQYIIPMDYDPNNTNDLKSAREFNFEIDGVSVVFLNILYADY